MEKLDTIDDVFGLEEDEARRREIIMAEIMKESSWREAQLYLKARIKWITEGDLNSRFFHNWINMRYKRNELQGIWSNGTLFDSVRDVKSEIFRH